MAVILDYGLRLPVHRMAKLALSQGDHVQGIWGWMRDGEYCAKITYWMARQGPREARLRLSYTREGKPSPMTFASWQSPAALGACDGSPSAPPHG